MPAAHRNGDLRACGATLLLDSSSGMTLVDASGIDIN